MRDDLCLHPISYTCAESKNDCYQYWRVKSRWHKKYILIFETLPLYQTTTFWTGPKLEAFVDDKLSVAKIIVFFLIDYKILQEKEKMLVTTMFSKAFFLWVKSGLCGTGLTYNPHIFRP